MIKVEYLSAGSNNDVNTFSDYCVAKTDKIFQNFDSAHKQKVFLKSHPLYEAPQKVLLSTNFRTSFRTMSNEIVPENQDGYYAPFLSSLRKFVEHKWSDIRFNFNESEIFDDVFHGKSIKRRMNALGDKTLAIALYYDDFEITNPIGSNKKIHKMGKNFKII